eukprot:CAMPEP_0198716836 /NCGR_PEP_ID=MMETSP1471-20131121/40507_1 /TAXON_ID=41880 /ORGANISM="Pycnococcus provasolii, Strain RCC733" /LENGTH=106 /DNA_ID=CAMNT_0044477381 /DNA_START=24 /DNA_END=344 /DNA_ORIENTATION=-
MAVPARNRKLPSTCIGGAHLPRISACVSDALHVANLSRICISWRIRVRALERARPSSALGPWNGAWPILRAHEKSCDAHRHPLDVERDDVALARGGSDGRWFLTTK